MSGAADTWPLSARDAAAVLGISERTVRRAIGRCDLVAAKHCGVFRIDPAALERFGKRNRATTAPLPSPQPAQALHDPFSENGHSEAARDLSDRMIAALSAIHTLTGLGSIYEARGNLYRSLAVQWEVLNVVQRLCALPLIASLSNNKETLGVGQRTLAVPVTEALIGEIPLQRAWHLSSDSIDSYGIALTRREIEVLRLVATGESNREIADSLFISLATVKRHMTNILGKLGVSTRYEAALYARSHGLA